jgi:hypothetical protein
MLRLLSGLRRIRAARRAARIDPQELGVMFQ